MNCRRNLGASGRSEQQRMTSQTASVSNCGSTQHGSSWAHTYCCTPKLDERPDMCPVPCLPKPRGVLNDARRPRTVELRCRRCREGSGRLIRRFERSVASPVSASVAPATRTPTSLHPRTHLSLRSRATSGRASRDLEGIAQTTLSSPTRFIAVSHRPRRFHKDEPELAGPP